MPNDLNSSHRSNWNTGGEDGDLRGLISEEAARIAGVRRALQDRLVEVVVPEDDQVDGMILEVSTGVGGKYPPSSFVSSAQRTWKFFVNRSLLELETLSPFSAAGKEAMLFCAELLDMYQWYCAGRGWPCALTDCETTELEGVRHASLAVDHADAYGRLRFEAGVHRVQRVPRTEKAGRIHTSTVSVVVLPRPSPITIVIDPKVQSTTEDDFIFKHIHISGCRQGTQQDKQRATFVIYSLRTT